MNENKNASVNIFDLIDSICKDFRSEWKRGAKPRISNYLNQVPENAKANLFFNLLDAEIRYRRRKGETPNSSEYIKQFPEFKSQVRQAFDESTMGSLEEYGQGTNDGSRSADLTQSFDLQGASRLGDYELLEELGRGGFGVVYDAKHIKRNNRVALKTLPTGADGQEINAERLHKFRKEFRSLSEINHPHLVGMQTLEVDGHQWFFTMDLIEGEDFLSYVRPLGELDETRLRRSLQQLATGIIALHGLGIVHRDLKPSNVMVQAGGHLVILDFGLVAQLQSHTDMTVTKSGMFAGTPKYAAPEQMFGDRSEASDWYAFGVMVYEALTGQPPFAGNQIDVLKQKQTQDPPPIADDENLPHDLALLAEGLLKCEPAKRKTAVEVIETLQLDLDTKNFGSTHGSSATSDSIDQEESGGDEVFQEDVVLVGRDEQLAQLESVFQEFLQQRSPTVVWVQGKSGEGKSSLVNKFLASRHHSQDALVLSGRCYDRESVPYKVIDCMIEPLASFLRSNSTVEVSEFISPDIQILNQTFPVLRRVKQLSEVQQPDVTGMDNRQLQLRAFDALRELWIGIGRQIPILIFVDDLQWGDADSADMLSEILREPSPPVLLIGSFRSDEAEQSPFLNRWKYLQQRRSSINLHEITVQNLTERQALELLEKWSGQSPDSLDDELIQLIRESGGNPFLLELLYDSFQVRGEQASAGGLAELLDRRLARLPREAKQLLNAVAVAGQVSEIEELAAAAELSDQPLSLLTHMRSEKIIRLIGSKDDVRVDTYHDKVRETILAGMDEAQRKAIHLRLAEFIEANDRQEESSEALDNAALHPRLFDLAYHFSEADDPRAFSYLFASGQRGLQSFAVEEALEYFKEARKQMPSTIAAAEKFQLWLGLANATLFSGQVDESRKLFAESRALAQKPIEEGHCLQGIARGWLWLGKHIEARDTFYEIAELLGDPEPKSMFGKLYQILVSQFKFMVVPRWMRLGRRKESEEELFLAGITPEFIIALSTDFWGMAAMQLKQGAHAKFSSSSDRQLAAYSAFVHFFGLNGFHRFALKYQNLLERKLRDSNSKVLIAVCENTIAEDLYYLGRLEQAEAELIQSARKLQKIRAYHEGMSYHFLRHVESIRGRSERICAWAMQEYDFANKNADPVAISWAKYGLVDGLARAGNMDPAIRLAQEAAETLRQCESQTFLIADQELGRALIQAGRYQEARDTLTGAFKFFNKRFLFTELWLDILPLLTQSILGNNWQPKTNQQLDKQVLREAKKMAGKSRFQCLKFPNLKPHALRASGRVCVAQGNFGKAIKYFDKAIAAAEKIGTNYEKARSLMDKSLLDHPSAAADRDLGLQLIESLGSVLPEAELALLEIDRDAHFARAAEARARDREQMEIPPFDLESFMAD